MPPPRTLFDDAFRYALFLCRDRVLAEDLAQDAWRAVLSSGGPHDKRYLLRAVRSRWIDHARRPSLTVAAAAEDVGSWPSQPDPWTQSALWDAMAHLGWEERETMLLMVVEGWTATEVADHMGRSRNTVLSWHRRARVKLKEALVDHRESA